VVPEDWVWAAPVKLPGALLLVSESLKLLYVGSSGILLQSLSDALQKGAFKVLHQRAPHADALRAALLRQGWDLIIADDDLAGCGALTVLELLRELGIELPVIAVSRELEAASAVALMRAGANDYLQKGQLARLVPVVRRELREAASRQARRQAEALLRYQASHDALTGLVNRREFERRVDQAVKAARSGERRYALAFIDLDQFKVINDTCGHGAGDELLRQVAVLLADEVGSPHAIARLGGDEFGVLFCGMAVVEAELRLKRLLDRLKAQRFAWFEHRFDIGASIGLVAMDAATPELGELLAEADMACYAAKEGGRHRLHVFHADNADLKRRQGEMHWVSRLNRALQEGQTFELHWQRMHDIQGRDEAGQARHEVLLRLRQGKHELVPPGAFLPAAERYNLMPAIDLWVAQAVFERLAHDRSQGRRQQSYSVNVSGSTLNDDRYIAWIKAAAARQGLRPGQLCLEITETAAVVNLTAAQSFITELKGLGVQFALDDFGTGVSSFQYLKNLPVDFLKIDGGFVRDLDENAIDRTIVESINQVGHAMGLRTIAECVETPTVLACLKRIGVDYAQGNGLHPPERMPT
jgi:diguanylate cyclase (GGDEF)-like protein